MTDRELKIELNKAFQVIPKTGWVVWDIPGWPDSEDYNKFQGTLNIVQRQRIPFDVLGLVVAPYLYLRGDIERGDIERRSYWLIHCPGEGVLEVDTQWSTYFPTEEAVIDAGFEMKFGSAYLSAEMLYE